MKKQAVDDNLTLVQNTLELWLSFKRFMLRSFADAEIGSSDETDFLEVKSSLSKNLRSLTERIKLVGNIDFGEKTIRELLTKCVSVSHLRQLPKNDQKALKKEWHGVFIRLSRCVGALKLLSEGYVPPSLGAKGKRKKGGSGSKKGLVIGIVVTVVVIGGAVAAAVVFGLVG